MLVCYLFRKHQFSYRWWAQILSSTASLGKRTWGKSLVIEFNNFWISWTGCEAIQSNCINLLFDNYSRFILWCNNLLFFFTRTFLSLRLTALNICIFCQSLMTSSKWWYRWKPAVVNLIESTYHDFKPYQIIRAVLAGDPQLKLQKNSWKWLFWISLI